MSELNKEYLVAALAEDIDAYLNKHRPHFELPDKWIFKSLLQKMNRRNDPTNALQATACLIEIDRRNFWRRLPIIYWEDIVSIDLEPCAVVDCVAGSKRLRATSR